MNSKLQEIWSMVDGTHRLRDHLLDALEDGDLGFNPGGSNKPLGALVREMGEVEHAYAESFRTFKQDWSYHNTASGIDRSVAGLREWIRKLDSEFSSALEALKEGDLAKSIERGFPISPEFQLQVYLQALLIFFGKATIFFRAMNRPLPDDIQQWIW